MASNSRRQIEHWLKTIDVNVDRVADVGGLFMPVQGRTKSWNVLTYEIWDVKKNRNGVIANYTADFNTTDNMDGWDYDVVFCIEVTDHFWNPVKAFKNINDMMKKGGTLYISSNFLFPHHTGFDCIRFTITGLSKVLSETGFAVTHYEPRFAKNVETLGMAMRNESKVYYNPGAIGFMVTAKKL